jgi:RHS repeat-associated protein
MHWDYKDQLRQIDLGGGGTAFYVYDASGQRVRKVWEKAPGLTEERLYIGGFEIFRKHRGAIGANTLALERETLHVMDDTGRLALVETRTLDTEGCDRSPHQLIRYQFGNHQGSASLELDDEGGIISYEEYAPYGSSTYQAVRSQTEAAKRYRYTGKERDEESGFYYHGARYYAAWLGRWTAADPAGLVDGPNPYVYGRSTPLNFTDSTGTQCDPNTQSCVDPTLATVDDQSMTCHAPDTSSSSSRSSGLVGASGASSLLGTLFGSASQSAAPAEQPFVLIGTSRSQMRTAAQALINADPNHPLQFLLDENGTFRPTRGLTHAELMDAPDLVQMGHIGSDKLGGPERLMLQDAWENQFNNLTIESPRVGGAVLEQRAVNIGGIAVSERSALSWELAWEHSGGATGLPPGTTASAPVIPEPGMPPVMSGSGRFFAAGGGAFSAAGGVFMLASIDTEHDPGIVTFGKAASGGASVTGGGIMIGGALAGEASAVALGGAIAETGGLLAVPIMVYEMRPRGWVAIDPLLVQEATNRYERGENVNPFCAQCHGPRGALDPNNDWNAGGARRAAFVNRLQWRYLGD